jgi:glycosyltransferase involved in cell wall biosynthesis
MRIAFYAPLKSPDHAVPSGDRRVGRLLIEALELAGHQVDLASALRSYEPKGDLARQLQLRDEGLSIAEAMVRRWSRPDSIGRPDLWFTYHVYYKAPDWLGPRVASELGIPYVIAEASFAPKRAGGAWSLGHTAAADAIRAASLLLSPIEDDRACLEPLMSAHAKLASLPPFLDPAIYRLAARTRAASRERMGEQFSLDPAVPWIVVAAMMRTGDKVASYRRLASALGRLTGIPWQAVIAGDGSARDEVESVLGQAAPGRVRFLGERQAEELASIYAACDLCIWPAVNEAYGMALLEAQAAGVPVVSHAVRGVPDVVCHERTGLLAPADDEAALVSHARRLLTDERRRSQMSQAAARFVGDERSVGSAAAILGEALSRFSGCAEVQSAAAPRT